MKILGVDPGLKGGLTILDTEALTVTVFRMPVNEVKKGKKKKNVYDIVRVFEAIPEGIYRAYMEQVGAMPGQGVSSTWRFAEGVGILKSAVYARTGQLAISVTPQKWKKYFELSDDKNLSRDRAMAIFPLGAPKWKTKRARILDEGVTESSLIAAYGALVDCNIPLDVLTQMVTHEVLI